MNHMIKSHHDVGSNLRLMNLWMIEIYSQQPSDSFTVAYGW